VISIVDRRWSTLADVAVARHVDVVSDVFHILLLQLSRLLYQRTGAGLNLREFGNRQGQPFHAVPVELHLSTRILSQAFHRDHRTFTELGVKHLQACTHPSIGVHWLGAQHVEAMLGGDWV
jgi:hypothetical protein